VISCEARMQVPVLGLWAAIAAARSAALDLKGALFDAAAVRLTTISSYQQSIAGRGVLIAADHVAVSSVSGGGLYRWHTSGMPKFGLPDLELLDAPPGADLGPTLVAVAQLLLDGLLTVNHGRDQPLAELAISHDLGLQVPGGPATVSLAYAPAKPPMPHAIEVILPRA
jgi:hypothetical protein